MNQTEFRILGEMAVCIAAMLPVALVVFSWRRKRLATVPAVASESEAVAGTESALQPPPVKLGKGELIVGMVLSLLLLGSTFGAKAIEVVHPELLEKQPSGGASPVALLINLMVIQGMPIAVIAVWFFTTRRTSLIKVFHLAKYRPAKALGISALLLIPATVLSLLALILVTLQLKHLGWPIEEQDAVQMLKGSKDTLTLTMITLAACVGAPLAEELIFRGMVYGPLRNMTDKWFAMIFSALLFAIIHVSVPVFVPLALLGFFFALAYEITGSLTISILMHLLFNSLQVFLTRYYGG